VSKATTVKICGSTVVFDDLNHPKAFNLSHGTKNYAEELKAILHHVAVNLPMRKFNVVVEVIQSSTVEPEKVSEPVITIEEGEKDESKSKKGKNKKADKDSN
jgi:hypothetical protein